MTLSELGWNTALAHALATSNTPDLHPARVIQQDRNRYQLIGATEALTGILPGKGRDLRFEMPVVGDWVLYEPLPDTLVLIKGVLPRRSTFARKVAGETTNIQTIAANFDTLFIIAGLDGDFNVRRLERYVTQGWDSGAMPVIVLNKADLVDDLTAFENEVSLAAPGVAIHSISAETGWGLEKLTPYFATGQTVLMTGSSGVGKSTLLNQLLGEDIAETGAVREDDSRGRHTTSARTLYLCPGGGLLIDTPGLRELQLWTDESALAATFTDIEALATECRLRDCNHDLEPGCAVKAAVETGDLDEDRLYSYQKLQRELAYLAQKQEEAKAHHQRRYEKKFSKLVKQITKHNPKRR